MSPAQNEQLCSTLKNFPAVSHLLALAARQVLELEVRQALLQVRQQARLQGGPVVGLLAGGALPVVRVQRLVAAQVQVPARETMKMTSFNACF